MSDLDPAQRSDEDLAAALADGDAAALVELADRYTEELYDFALRTTLDPAMAVNVVEVALTRARDDAGSRRRGLPARAWLLGVARDAALDALRDRGAADADPAAPTPLSPLDDRLVETSDAANRPLTVWAWQAARSQRPRDYSQLDLAVRRKLSPEEIADITGGSRTGIYTVLGRLRGSFEESFAASALFFRGRDACADLNGIVGDQRDLRPALRRDIARHAETCDTCRITLTDLPLAADLYSSLANVDMPNELIDRIEALVFPNGVPDARAGPEEEQPTLPLAAAGAAGAVAAAGAAELTDSAEEEEQEEAEILYDEEVLGDEDEELEEDDSDLFIPGPMAIDDQAPDEIAAAVGAGDADRDAEPPRPVPLTFERGQTRPAAAPELIRFSQKDLYGGSRRSVPGRLGAMFGGDGDGGGPKRLSLLVLVIGITLIAAYFGMALADSISGGGDDSSSALSGIPNKRPDGTPLIPCGTGPTTIDQGQAYTLSFDPRALAGYAISGVTVRPISANAGNNSVRVNTQGATNVVFEALPAAGPSGRLDEYRLDVTLASGNNKVAAECVVLVRAPGTPTGGATGPRAPTGPGGPPATGPRGPTGAPGPAGSPTRVP